MPWDSERKATEKNGLMRWKSIVALFINDVLHVQKYKFVDFLYTDMQNSSEYSDHH